MTGYRIYNGSSSAVTSKAIALLSQEYGYRETAVINGKELLFVVETHTIYGSQPDRPPSPHKGVTVYEKVDDNPPLLGPVLGIALGIGYLLWPRK